MNTINVENCKTLLIGRRGENEVTTVAFDFTEWATEFGSGVVDLYVKRFGDDSAYPVVLTIDGTVASWLVTETDTNVAGYGKAEYVYRVDGKIAKSAVFPFFVAEDIGQPASEPPDPYESWLEQLTALGAETQANAEAAQQSAEDAAQSAQEAAESAASVEGAVEQAEAARDAAQTAQASAETSATAASGSAASAAGSASDASSSASAAGTSATAASASATTASNAATAAQTAQSAAEDAAEDAQQAAQQAHVEYEQLSGEVDDLSDEVTRQKSAIEDLQVLTNRKAGALIDTASGAIASFIPDATIPDLLGVSVDIEPVQAGSGDPSPDNVRPISGWNSVEVEADGINLFDKAKITHLYCDGSMTLQENSDMLSVYVELVQGATYTFTQTSVGTFTRYAVCDSLEAGVPFYNPRNGTAQIYIDTVPFTFTANRKYLICTIYRASADVGKTFDDFADTCQLEFGSTASEYKPYAGNRYIIQLGQTVYGAKLDVDAGALTLDRSIKSVPSMTTIYGLHVFWTSDLSVPYMCDAYKTAVGGDSPWVANAVIKRTSEPTRLYINDQRFSTLEEINGWLNDNPINIVYYLANPIVIQLDPVTISTISGQTNNLWADAGDVTVEFAADLKHYIDSKIAAAVAAMS